jgi:sugar phosphate permease
MKPFDEMNDRYIARRRFLIFLIISTTYIISYFHRAAPAVVGPVIMDEMHLNAEQLGIVGSMYFWAYAATALPSGILSDTWGARKTIALFVFLAGIGGLLFAHSGSVETLATSRFLIGLGVGVVYVAAMRVFSDWYNADELATYSGLLLAAGNIGALMSTAPLVFAMKHVGWRCSFDIIALLTFLASAVGYMIIRNRPSDVEPRRSDTPRVAADFGRPVSLLASVKTVWGENKIYLLGALLFSFYGTFMGVGSLWAGTYLRDVYGLSKADSGSILMFFPLGMAIGCPLAGYLSDKIFGSRRAVLLYGGILHLTSYIPLVFFNDSLGSESLKVLFFWYGISGGTFVVCFACVKEIYEKQFAGTAVGSLNIFLFAGGAFYQYIMGVVISVASGGSNVVFSEVYSIAFSVPMFGLLIGILVFAFFRERATEMQSVDVGAR